MSNPSKFITSSAPGDGVAYDDADQEPIDGVLIAELATASGTQLRFVRERTNRSGGQIGVLETTPPGADQIVPAMLRGYAPTPLELFLVIASEADAPPYELVEDHRREAARRDDLAPEPRRLPLLDPPAAGDAVLPPHLVSDLSPQHGQSVALCESVLPQSYFSHFQAQAEEFLGDLPQHGHGFDLTSSHYGITGLSSRRALGCCNRGPYVKGVRVEYQWTQNLWLDASGGQVWIFPNYRFFYHSDSWPLIRRYRIRVFYTVEGQPNLADTVGCW